MAIITRFRARLHNLQCVSKLDSQLQAEKTAQTVCLLSVVLLLPYFARCQASILVGLIYTCLVLPMVVSANYKYPVSALKGFTTQLSEWSQYYLNPTLRFLSWLYGPLNRLEQSYIRLSNIFTMSNQLVFFMLCDRLLVPEQKVTSLYSLMFYNVIAYCISYIKELIEKEDWSPYVNMTDHSNIKHLAMSATKIVLEWTKAVTFIITVVFMLLVFGLEQGLDNYRPTAFYTIFTWLYYMATEKVLVELIIGVSKFLQLPAFESLEALWITVGLKVFTIVISLLLTLPLLFMNLYRLAFASLYLNVHLRYKEMNMNCLKELNMERAVLGQYRYATAEELAEFDDICAVCLSSMQVARITPCHHLFHGECLRQCLKASNKCPICKREFRFD